LAGFNGKKKKEEEEEEKKKKLHLRVSPKAP
jgi:hypothetical protein